MITNRPDTEEEYIEADALIRCLISSRQLLNTGRGRFYPDKNFGSQLALLQSPINACAAAYAAQALAESDGIDIVDARQQGNTVVFYLNINGEEGRVNYRIHENV